MRAVLAVLLLLPMLAGALEVLTLAPVLPGVLIGSGQVLLVVYGQILLCLMGGALWGLAARRGGWLWHGVVLMVPVWVLLTAFSGTRQVLAALLLGFVLLPGLDWGFSRAGLAPAGWLRFRVWLSLGAVLCLAVGLFGSPLI